MKLKTLLQPIVGCRAAFNENPEITSVETDSRTVTDGSLFVCIKGYSADRHDYIDQAVDAGAAAVVADHPVTASVPVAVVPNTNRAASLLIDTFYDHPTSKLHLIGVTGTNGKTTTTHLIENMFVRAGQKTGLIGTIGMTFDRRPLGLKAEAPTTPDAVTLQKGFATMVDKGADTAIMEVSSHALDMGRVHGCDFNIAVFTNLSQDHLEYHKTMDDYFRAKSLLFSQLGNTYSKNPLKLAVINGDDERAPELYKATAVQFLVYGITCKDADVRAENVVLTEKGTTFTLCTPYGDVPVHLPLVGMFNVYNALAAASAALFSGLSLDTIKASLENERGVPGRFELVEEGQSYAVIVDYAHTPDSLENVLKTAKAFASGRIIVVVGCGGDRDPSKRPLMARIAVKYGDMAVFTSDNPRTEDPQAILKDMERGVKDNSYVSIVNRKEAIEYAIRQASGKDLVLIAGKGHETYQIIGEDVIDFDDREVAREAIKGKRG
ncbi:MAG TPA: UDP-N-acetylmuramoyl-L-alanyl-D-glutamate--2,6-diaminopimelate ligase [Bacillales bacterium]|nr:UDP-N-acetylmuramoyl-L-alanyl-D-glutamate--2,6-diaminopimelate ligase [Bacillales bacterium]